MAGIDASKVYLPTPVQTATTGAIAIAPVGTAMPATASEALGSAWQSGGYIGDAGISISTNKGVTTIKDWSQGAVRKALSDFDGTISVPFLQIDEFAAKRLVGAANVHTSAHTTEHGNILAIDLGPSMPDEEAYVFSMKDGDSRVRVEVPRGQITAIDAVSFVPNAANSWPGTLSCFTGADGYAIRVIYEDGTIITDGGSTDTPSVTIRPNSVSVAAGSTVTLEAICDPSTGTVTWSSNNEAKATVEDGVVTGVAAGSATITASMTVGDNTYTDTCSVTVTAASNG